MTDAALRSPLHDRHQALGAKFSGFAGWDMPLEYAGGGVIKEHTAVRERVGLFDVSHLGKINVSGPGAADFVNSCLSNDLGRIGPGQAQYTLCVDDATGGVVDDMIAYLYGQDRVFIVPNAANTAEVARRLAAQAPDGITVADQHRDYAVLALQGPSSPEVLRKAGLPSDHDYMSFTVGALGGDDVVVCRTGYTGEHGYELVIPWSRAGEIWDALMAAGASFDIAPAGLAARDTLRTEMGYPLHGQDMSMQISLLQAGAGWAVGWKKPAFWGRDALTAEKAAGPRRRLWGLLATDRAIPRAHMSVYSGDSIVGEITSGTFSPTRRIGIALALLDTGSEVGEGSQVTVDVRGKRAAMTVVKPPFVPAHVR
jgi:aminomethyltransferase